MVQSTGERLAERALQLLRDRDYVVSGLPYVVGLSGGRITVYIKKFFVKLKDNYNIRIKGEKDSVTVYLEGEKSRITLRFWLDRGELRYRAHYTGPRSFILSRAASSMASKLASQALEDARRHVQSRVEASGPDVSAKLASVSWIAWLLQRSILLEQRLLVLPPGGLLSQIEEILGEGRILEDHSIVYISGSGEKGSFKVLFVDGRLAGVYANVGGREYVGDESALRLIDGLVTVKIYGVLSRAEEVLQR